MLTPPHPSYLFYHILVLHCTYYLLPVIYQPHTSYLLPTTVYSNHSLHDYYTCCMTTLQLLCLLHYFLKNTYWVLCEYYLPYIHLRKGRRKPGSQPLSLVAKERFVEIPHRIIHFHSKNNKARCISITTQFVLAIRSGEALCFYRLVWTFFSKLWYVTHCVQFKRKNNDMLHDVRMFQQRSSRRT